MKPKLNTVIVPFPNHATLRSVFPYAQNNGAHNSRTGKPSASETKAVLISDSHHNGTCALPQTVLLDNVEGTLTIAAIEKWLNQYEQDHKCFVSPVLFTRAKLFEMQNMTSHLMPNHPFRIAVIADLFTKLSAYPVYETVLQPFRNEIFHFLFGNQYDPQNFDTYGVRDYLSMLQINEKYHSMGIYRPNTAHASIMGAQSINLQKSLHTPSLMMRNKLKQVQAKLGAVHQLAQPLATDEPELDARASKNIQFLKNLVLKHDKKLLIIVARVWSYHSKRKKKQIASFLDRSGFRAKTSTMKACFQFWAKYRNQSNNVKLTMQLERVHGECAELNVKVYQLTKKLQQTEKSAREHIAALAMDLDDSSSGSSSFHDEKQMGAWNESERKLNVQWLRYIASNYKIQLTEIRNKLDDLFEKKLFDPMLIGDVLTNLSYKDSFQFTILNSENIETVSSEALLLNWVNFILTGRGTGMFVDLGKSKTVGYTDSNNSISVSNDSGNSYSNSLSTTKELASKSTMDFTFSADYDSQQTIANLKTETLDMSTWNKAINNFSLDFQSGDVYLILLTMLFGDMLNEQYTVRKLANLTNGQKIEIVLKQFESLGFNSDNLLTYDSIADGRADLNFVMISRLMNLDNNCQIVLTRHNSQNHLQEVYNALEHATYRVTKLFKSRKNRDQTAATKIHNEVVSAIELATKEYDMIYRNHNAWIAHQKTVLNYCNKILQSNVVNSKMPCLLNNDPLYKEMISSMINIINFDTLQQQLKLAGKTDTDLKTMETEHGAIIALIKKHQSLLTQIFIHYAGISARKYPILVKNITNQVIEDHKKFFNAHNEPCVIHLNEFVKLAKDANIPDDTMTLAKIKSILDAAYKPSSTNSKSTDKKTKLATKNKKPIASKPNKPSKPKAPDAGANKTSIASRTARYKIKNHVKLKQEQRDMLNAILPYSLTICRYVLMLLKISKIKFGGVSQSLTQSFQCLIEGNLKTMFNNIMNDDFRKLISLDSSMQKMLAEYETSKLYPIFERCVSISNILRDRNKATVASKIRAQLNGSGIDASDNSWRSNSTVAGIAQVLSRNCGLFELGVVSTNANDEAMSFGTSTLLNEAVIHELVKVIQKSAVSNQDPFYCQVLYEEFLQLMVAIALYVNNNPFHSVKQKVEVFFNELKFRTK